MTNKDRVILFKVLTREYNRLTGENLERQEVLNKLQKTNDPRLKKLREAARYQYDYEQLNLI